MSLAAAAARAWTGGGAARTGEVGAGDDKGRSMGFHGMTGSGRLQRGGPAVCYRDAMGRHGTSPQLWSYSGLSEWPGPALG